MSMQINDVLRCEVDVKRSDCNREPAHCHIVRKRDRVAQVWLNPVLLEKGHSLDHKEQNIVLDFVANHVSELEREYEYNREHGAYD